MRNRGLWFICAFWLLPALTLGATIEERLVAFTDRVRVQLEFASWPGKNASLKKGIAFDPSGYPPLWGYEIKDDSVSLGHLELGLVRDLVLKKGESGLRVTIAVTHTSTDKAQELLLFLGAPRCDLGASAYERGDTAGLSVGDVNIVISGSGTSPKNFMAFARNNVACVLRRFGSDDPGLDIKTLAELLDAKISALPNLTAAQFDATRPTITNFQPANPSIKLYGSTGESTVIKMTTNDPAGEALKRVFPVNQALRIDGEATPPTVAPGEEFGSFTLKMILVNDSLQYNTAETTIAVLDARDQVDPNAE